MSPARSPLRVAVLGAGTVGREVVRAFLETPERLQAGDGAPLQLAGVAARNLDRAAASGIPPALLTDAPAHLVADPDVDVIVELMGGSEPARTLIEATLGAGKAVVTANKHVLARHGSAFEAASRRTGAALRFEASVGGGIPVLTPLATDLAANQVDTIRGIVNGTSNYILTAMARDGSPYASALADAQAAGYAEADPAADVEGHDAASKLVILARLAFGTWLDPADVRLADADGPGHGQPGIVGVTAADVAAARAAGDRIKLIAAAARADDGGIEVSVVATAVPAGSALASTDGVLNRIEVEARPVGLVAFSGPGAGGPATASAVLGDLIAIARGLGSTWAGLAPATAASRSAASAAAGQGAAAAAGSAPVRS